MHRTKIQLVAVMMFCGLTAAFANKIGDYRFFDPLIDIHQEILRNGVEQPKEEDLQKGAILGLIEAMKDPFTQYFDADQQEKFAKHINATFTGIGAEIGAKEDGQLVINSPLEGSPALKAGMRPGDEILEIDGKPTKGMTRDNAVENIVGPKGTVVKIKVRHTDAKEEVLSITRDHIIVKTVKGFKRQADDQWDFMLDEKNKIGYIRLLQFSNPTTEEMMHAVKSLSSQGVKALILDMRSNPGGSLKSAIEVSDLFLTKGKIVSTRGRNSPEQSWSAESGNEIIGAVPMVVMVNGMSASAAEIVAGALKYNDRAMILGTRSFGKGSVQQVIPLQAGKGAIKLTTAYYYLPNGQNLHKRDGQSKWGVDPHDGYYVGMTGEEFVKMDKARNDLDIIHHDEKKRLELLPPAEVTTQYLNEKLADRQLAAALETLQAKLATNEFKKVGKSNATVIELQVRREAVIKRRDQLAKSAAKLDEELEKLDQLIEGVGSPEAKPAEKSAEKPVEKPQVEPGK